MSSSLTLIILAAGESRRMHSFLSKVLHPLGGRPVLAYVLEQAIALNPLQLLVVASSALAQNKAFQELLPPHTQVVIQEHAKGTGDAVRIALSQNKKHSSHTLVLFGDTPLLSRKTLDAFYQHHLTQQADLSVLGIRPLNPQGYGRLLVDPETHQLYDIREEKEADEQTRALTLCNGGVMLLSARALTLLDQLTPHNTAGEYYLTDLVRLGRNADFRMTFLKVPFEEVLGINTRGDLAQAEAFLQHRWRTQALEKGVTLMDPTSTYLSFDTCLASDITLYPHVFLGPGVTLERDVIVFPFSVLTHIHAKESARIGPFCHLRDNTLLEKEAVVGNFVEIKKSTLGAGVAAKHLSYLGDATIGAGTNIGAGTITCNYDGHRKHPTYIGERAFIGSHTALIAPISVGDDALIGAGSVITKTVPPQTLALSRTTQQHRPLKPRG